MHCCNFHVASEKCADHFQQGDLKSHVNVQLPDEQGVKSSLSESLTRELSSNRDLIYVTKPIKQIQDVACSIFLFCFAFRTEICVQI